MAARPGTGAGGGTSAGFIDIGFDVSFRSGTGDGPGTDIGPDAKEKIVEVTDPGASRGLTRVASSRTSEESGWTELAEVTKPCGRSWQ